MKKVLIGCGIVALIGIVIVCGAGIFLWSKAKNIGEAMQQVVEAIDAGVSETDTLFPFDLPEPLAGGEAGLDAERFGLMLEVRKAASEKIRESSLYAIIQESERAQQQGNDDFPIFKLLGALDEIGPDAEVILAAMFEKLRDSEMSYKEYWHLTYLGLSAVSVASERGIELTEIPDEVQAQMREMQQAFAGQPQMAFEFEQYRSSWNKEDDQEILQALDVLRKHQEEIEQAKESIFFDFIIKAIEQQMQAQNAGR